MVRADDDTWDITQSVGATALGCAEWRAREAENARPLFTDPYAQFFLDEATARGGSSVIHSNLYPVAAAESSAHHCGVRLPKARGSGRELSGWTTSSPRVAAKSHKP